MDDQQNLDSQSSKDRPWTTEEIRKHSSNWTLAGDVGLFNLLNEFSHQIISRTHEVENAVDSLVHQTKMTTAKVNNVINDFHMLSNLQFVENRVYDEEVQEPVTENKHVVEKTKEQREAEMLPKIVQAIELGLAVLDTAFDRINVNEISDSEDEDVSSEGHTILEPKDPYENRPLPYIIGSEEFMKCDYAGLKDLIEDDAQSLSEQSSISETDETSTDEGEPLPHDDDRFSEKPSDETSQTSFEKKTPMEKMFDNISSSSDESELFGAEKEVNGFGSESSLDFKSKEKNIQRAPADTKPEEEIRKSSISSLQSKLKLPQVLPVPKLQERNEDDLFAKEDNSDDESPFRKKTGLFATDIKFKDEKDEDLFGEDLFGKTHSEDIKEVKPVKEPKITPKKPPSSILPENKKLSLFDNDEDSEDDIFNTLMKTKKPTTTKTNTTVDQESPDKADTSSTPSSAPSTKPSGNAFDFVTGAGNGDSLFGDDSDVDDLFSSKKASGKKFQFDSSENEDLFDTITSKKPKESKVLGETKSSLFEDKKSPDEPKKRETENVIKQKTKQSLFGDSDSSDVDQVLVKSPISVPKDNKKGISLFDDDDDLEEDIFSNVAKQSKPNKPAEKTKSLSIFEDSEEVTKESKSSKPVEKSKPANLFEDTQQMKSKDSKPSKDSKSAEKPKNTSLFSDTEEESSEPLSAPKVQPSKQSKLPSLFDENESDSFDLFSSKPLVKPTESVESLPPVNIPSASAKVPSDEDRNMTSKVSSPAKDTSSDSQVSFDTPVDSSNILNVVNKSRVRVSAKRRKPTRQGRLAALENSEKETQAISPNLPSKIDSDDTVNDSDSLFSTASATKPPVKPEPPKLDYKSQEKKKMNLMSQLMSEVATSKVTLKKSAEKQVEDEEDEDVDIFSQTAKESKGSFSFKTPEDKGISTLFPAEKKEEKDDLNASKSDSFEDDFFTEPAFQNFRSSISHKDPVLDLEDDDDDDDLFSAIKSNVLPKVKKDSSDSNDLFGDDTDIFVDAQKEKYEMFPSQVYDEDDDIFSSASNAATNKLPSKTSNSSSIKKVEMKPADAFDDPLRGLLGE